MVMEILSGISVRGLEQKPKRITREPTETEQLYRFRTHQLAQFREIIFKIVKHMRAMSTTSSSVSLRGDGN